MMLLMLLIILFTCTIQLGVQVLSEATLAPPYHIHVKEGLITWTPATEERDVNYSVQYRSFGDTEWKNVSACFHTSFSSCNITFTKAESENGCVRLRVKAERHGVTSRPVEACSKHGDTCTPMVNLTARPGSLTVYLRISLSLVQEYGGHIQNRVFYGREGESLEENYKDGASSVSIHSLQKGSIYCIKVQYLLHGKVLGTDSCIQCKMIPQSAEKPKLTEVIVAVVVVVALAILIPVIGYILIFQRKKIKAWLQPPYNIPEHFLLAPNVNHQLSSPSEDEYHAIVIKELGGE